MLFSSITFISIFLPITLFFYYSLKRQRNAVLVIASVVFYAWAEPRYLAIVLFSILIAFYGALLFEKTKHKMCIFFVIGLQLAFLVYFKYMNFFIESINDFFQTSFPLLKLILPIGISFYTFRVISYLMDVYHEEVEIQHNIYDFALYVLIFPQIMAGPIVRYKDMISQIANRSESFEKFLLGLKRFIIGLSKKMLIGNTLGIVVDKIFELPVIEFDTLTAWLGAFCYMFQIYYDFSGYSDMAIGLGLMFGFKTIENFNYPYVSNSITDFWRRWHISLGEWFKYYLYIPLGGNRGSKIRNILNLFVVFLATGIWHGASWNFIFWGLWNGFFVIFEKITGLNHNVENKIFSFFQHIYAFFIILIGWIFFRSENLNYAIQYIRRMFCICDKVDKFAENYYYMDRLEIALFCLGFVFIFPVARNVLKIKNTRGKIIVELGLIILFVLSGFEIAASTYNPFIYFQF